MLKRIKPCIPKWTFCTFNLDVSVLFVLEPLRQTSARLNNANEIRLLIHDKVLAYYSPSLMATSSANRLWYLRHSVSIPSIVVKTKGVNVPCSPMSKTLLNTDAFSCSHAYDTSVVALSLYNSACGWQNLTSVCPMNHVLVQRLRYFVFIFSSCTACYMFVFISFY